MAADSRLAIDTIGDDFYRATIRYGFMETPDVPLALMRSGDRGGMCFDPMETTYFASRETIVGEPQRGMPIWRDRLFGVHAPQCGAGDGFLPHSDDAAGRTRGAGGNLIALMHRPNDRFGSRLCKNSLLAPPSVGWHISSAQHRGKDS